MRNVSQHVSLSLLNATRALAEKRISEEPSVYSKIPDNPVVIIEYEFESANSFVEMLDGAKAFYLGFGELLERMIKDYSALIGESATIKREKRATRNQKDHTFVNEYSWASQVGNKFDLN